jgi:membrane associated rhomboid family serine protease
MAVSDISGHRQKARFWKRLLGQLSRYDLLLAVIPILFGLALLTYLLAPVSLHVPFGASGLISGALVADALYFNPPARSVTEEQAVESVDESVASQIPERGD